jgi:hypothetical protein
MNFFFAQDYLHMMLTKKVSIFFIHKISQVIKICNVIGVDKRYFLI